MGKNFQVSVTYVSEKNKISVLFPLTECFIINLDLNSPQVVRNPECLVVCTKIKNHCLEQDEYNGPVDGRYFSTLTLDKPELEWLLLAHLQQKQQQSHTATT